MAQNRPRGVCFLPYTDNNMVHILLALPSMVVLFSMWCASNPNAGFNKLALGSACPQETVPCKMGEMTDFLRFVDPV